MIRVEAWQAQAIEEFQATLTSSTDVLALALFGSALQSGGQLDLWSDLDFLLVVNDDAYSRFYPATEWLKPFGELYAHQQAENAFSGTTRVCFADLRRLDIVITTQSKLDRLVEWPHIPFWQGVRRLISRSPQVTQLLSQSWPSPKMSFRSPHEFDEMVNHFWFKAMLAGHKVIRNDLLIALHLALDLMRDCCVVGMMLRDRAEGTNVHREGGVGNSVVADLESARSAFTATGILDIIEQSSVQFDQLAAHWSDTYHERRYPLIEWLRHIRRALSVG